MVVVVAAAGAVDLEAAEVDSMAHQCMVVAAAAEDTVEADRLHLLLVAEGMHLPMQCWKGKMY